MRLSEFIEREIDHMADEWAEYAWTSIPAARNLSPDQLRDHGRQPLLHIADDTDTLRSSRQ